MFLKWSTSLSTLLKKQLSVIGALFIFISQVSLSHLNQWFMSYLIFYGGSLELLFWQLFLFSFHFFFLLCFWVFNNLFIFFNTKTPHLSVLFVSPHCVHAPILCAATIPSYAAVPTPLCAAVPPPPSPNAPSSPHLVLSPLHGIMLTRPGTEPFLVIAFSTQHSSHSLTGARNVLCQDVSASTSWVTALGQFVAAEERKAAKAHAEVWTCKVFFERWSEVRPVVHWITGKQEGLYF